MLPTGSETNERALLTSRSDDDDAAAAGRYADLIFAATTMPPHTEKPHGLYHHHGVIVGAARLLAAPLPDDDLDFGLPPSPTSVQTLVTPGTTTTAATNEALLSLDLQSLISEASLDPTALSRLRKFTDALQEGINRAERRQRHLWLRRGYHIVSGADAEELVKEVRLVLGLQRRTGVGVG